MHAVLVFVLKWRCICYLCLFCTVGLDAAGKTTILYKLKLGEIVTTIPTIGKRGGREGEREGERKRKREGREG